MSDSLRNNSLYTHRGSGEQVIIREVSNGMDNAKALKRLKRNLS